MKVGINARTFSVDQPDGAVQAAVQLTNALHSRADTEVVCYCPEPNPSKRIRAPTKSLSVGSSSQFYGVAWERTALPLMAMRDDLDVLLCPNGNAPLSPIPDVHIAMYIHDVNALRGMSGGIHRLYRKMAVPWGAKVADQIFTVSQFSKREISNVMDIDSEKVDVIYNGIDDIYLNDVQSKKCDLPGEYILYVGAMNPRKNVQGIINAYEHMKEDVPHKLVLIGPQNKLVYQEFEVDDDDSIITPGFLPELELKYAYESADVFLYPSIYEGFGLPPLEAMACGTPVVSSNTTSLAELLRDAALLVDPKSSEEIANAVLKLINEPELRQKFVRKGRSHADQFSWERASDKLYTLLSGCLES